MKTFWKKIFLDIFNDQQTMIVLKYYMKELGKVLREIESPVLTIDVFKRMIKTKDSKN